MPQDAAQLVRLLRDNANDGAARIARQAVSMLRDFVVHAEGDAGLPARTRACAEALAQARPEMPALPARTNAAPCSFASAGRRPARRPATNAVPGSLASMRALVTASEPVGRAVGSPANWVSSVSKIAMRPPRRPMWMR